MRIQTRYLYLAFVSLALYMLSRSYAPLIRSNLKQLTRTFQPLLTHPAITIGSSASTSRQMSSENFPKVSNRSAAQASPEVTKLTISWCVWQGKSESEWQGE